MKINNLKKRQNTTKHTEVRMSDKPNLQKCSFTFVQEGNCNQTTDEYEELIIECESSLGIDNDEGCFYVLKTETGWSIDDVNDLTELITRINKVIKKDNK